MPGPPKLLSFLVADLIRAETEAPKVSYEDLLKAFKENPEAVMAAYGLSDEARRTLFTMDRELISRFMSDEILTTPAPPPKTLWGDPVAQITSVSPNALDAAEGQVVTVMGDCVLSSAVIHLESLASFNHIVGGKPTFDPMPLRLEDQTMVATFDLSQAAPGEYRVLVYNTEKSSPLQSKEIVTISRSAK